MDRARLPPLALSRFSIVTSLGVGADATVAALLRGASGLAPATLPWAQLPAYVGEVPGLDAVGLPRDLAAFDCRNNRLAALALGADGFTESVAAARERYGPHRIGVFIGTSTAGILATEFAWRQRDRASGALPVEYDYQGTHNIFSLAEFVQRSLALAGPAAALSAACATTAKAFGSAARMIAAGVCDAAIVGGADSLCATTLYGFSSLGLVSPGPCRPFGAARDGISIGEAAGFALIERPEACRAADPVLLLGIGESSDAYHMSSPHPEGVGARLAMEQALAAAGLSPGAIDYVNLHGTATLIGDAAEDCALSGLFGTATACSSTKGATGHTLGAAGIVEAIISALSIREGLLPGSPHTGRIDPALRSCYVTETRRARIDRVLSNSFGFGGANCSLVLGRAA